MARSSHIYAVYCFDVLLATFTVKWEAKAFIDRPGLQATHVKRYHDGPQGLSQYFTREEFMR